MNFLFASDSFKGSLSSTQTALILEKAAKAIEEELKILHEEGLKCIS